MRNTEDTIIIGVGYADDAQVKPSIILAYITGVCMHIDNNDLL